MAAACLCIDDICVTLGSKHNAKTSGPHKGLHHVNLPDVATKFCLRCFDARFVSFYRGCSIIQRLFATKAKKSGQAAGTLSRQSQIFPNQQIDTGVGGCETGFQLCQPVFRAYFTIDKTEGQSSSPPDSTPFQCAEMSVGADNPTPSLATMMKEKLRRCATAYKLFDTRRTSSPQRFKAVDSVGNISLDGLKRIVRLIRNQVNVSATTDRLDHHFPRSISYSPHYGYCRWKKVSTGVPSVHTLRSVPDDACFRLQT